MACTDGQDECGDVMRDVWLFLDDELDPERRAAVQRHLDECSPCLEQAGIQTKLKQLLGRKCGGDHAPTRLRERIVTQLSAGGGVRQATVTSTSVTQTSQSGPWGTSTSVTWSQATVSRRVSRRDGGYDAAP